MSETTADILVDPEVSRRKFDREFANFRGAEKEYRKRGCFLLAAEYPKITLAFGTPHLRPAWLLFAAIIDFADYDLVPPSVVLADPFSVTPCRGQSPIQLLRLKGVVVGPNGAPHPELEDFIQAGADGGPFICAPGIREYHSHPGHTGDSWLLHRGKGAGSLDFIVNLLLNQGIAQVQMGFAAVPTYQIAGP